MREFTLKPEGDLTLDCREYRPEGDPVGILQVIHGLGEHQGRYVSFARFLAENGFAAYTSDLPGHGPAAAETGSLGRFPRGGWLQAAEAQHALLERVKGLWPGKPVFLFGHSMGSFLARSCLILWPGGLQGCILCGTGHLARPLVAAGSAAAEVTAKLRGEGNTSEFLRKMAFGGYNFNLHFICPMMIMIAFLLVESQNYLTIRDSLICILPIILYSLVYFYNVVIINNWEDLYNFNTYLPFYISMPLIYLFVFLIGDGLRRINNFKNRFLLKHLTRTWNDDIDEVSIKIDIYGLGQYIGLHGESNSINMNFDVLDALSKYYDVDLGELVMAYSKGVVDGTAEKSHKPADKKA